MVSSSKFGSLSIILLLVISISIGLTAAQFPQYVTQKTTDVSIDSSGLFTANEPTLGVNYKIQGTPGASGSISAATYVGNPYPTAAKPQNVEMYKYIVISFAMNPQDFDVATITFTFTDSDVEGLQTPYAIYKYLTESNSYVEMPTTVNTEQKTLTIVLTSTDDPTFSIGGVSTETESSDLNNWIIIAVVAIVLIITAVLIVVYLLRSGRIG